MQNEKLLTADEVANMLNVSKSLIYRYTHLKKIPCLRLGKYLRFNSADISSWLDQHKRGGDEDES